MKKRGSLDLSINAIVILILAITMLGLGLAFMSGVFGSATEEFQEISGVIQKQIIDQMKQTDKVVELENPVKKIGVGEKKTTYIGFKNNQNEVINFIIKGIRVSSIPGAIIDCGLYEEDVILEYKHKATSVQPGTVAVLPMNIKTDSRSEKGTCFYEILIDEEDDSLVGYWNFNKEDDATDISGNGNDGTFMGDLENSPWEDDKLGGKAYVFDGSDDSIKVLDSPSLDIDNHITLSAFIKLKVDVSNRIFISKSGNAPINGVYSGYGFSHTGKKGWVFGAYNVINGPFSNPDPSDIGQWQHVTGVLSEGTRYLYVDSGFISEYTSGGNSWDNDKNLCIGSGKGCAAYMFKGIIDDVKVYNKALSESEVKQLAQGYDYSIQLTVNVE